MTPERWAQIRLIFESSLEQPRERRSVYVRSACGDDPELTREVASLLASHEDSGQFLNTPVANLNGVFATSKNIASYVETGEFPLGFRVGPYQLERRIGRGGMGTVWLASRVDQAFEKKVAIKLVKPGMDTQEILRRFRTERQVLASLDHPNIARLIDGGSTPDGLPYLVMDYIEGIRIDHFCEQRQSTISERLQLFRQVCSAVQYAHQNLIVHRDLKASNILVTPDGVPKLLDFGIAKLLRSGVTTPAPIETRTDLRPMTLDYASPEQARGEPITTSTDVYSLGVLLYRLLTGKFPYGSDRSPAAVQKAILESEPLRPSSVILTDTQSAIPQATQKMEVGLETRPSARKRLKRKLAGDLDAIVLKALRKEPRKRYASAEQFSEDVRRYLERRPVTARSGTFGYRAGRFIRRNVVSVTVVTGASMALIGGLLWSVSVARQTQRAIADREAAIEPALIENSYQLGTMLETTDAARAQAVYRQAWSVAHDFVRTHPAAADVRGNLARASMKLGDLVPAESLERYQEAFSQFEIWSQAPGRAFDGQREVVAAGRKLGGAQLQRGDRLGALATFTRASQLADALLAQDKGPSRDTILLDAASNFDLGEALARQGEQEAALSKLRKALQLYREASSSNGKVPLADNTVESLENAITQVRQ